ncbi:MAG: FecR domain-containing protein [Chitinophagaceae bacterium]|nr:FecR domain-containing protein [Chitinophagaceae bacterium]
MTINEARILTEKKLAGLASQEEIAALQAFINEYPDKEALVEALLPVRELSDIPDQTLPAGMEQRILSNILDPSKQSAAPEPHTAAPVIPLRRLLWRRALRASVAAAVIIAICIAGYQKLTKYTQQPAESWLSLSAPNGMQKSVVLKDGTHVQLNGGSTIRFTENFSAGKREVFLDGEAFFEVSKDSLRPFVVRTSTLSTTVLGTSFSVRSYYAEPIAQIAVSTGKVKVEVQGMEAGGHPTALLTPGRMATYALHDQAGLREQDTNVETIGAWKDHIFYYDRTNLKTILADLQRSYDLHFFVKDPEILDLKYTTTFRNMPVNAILKALERISPVAFNKKDHFIEVSARPSSITHH